MNLLLSVLKEHALRYPLMTPTDAVKLVYQSVFGGGHMIHDEKSALLRLKDEMNTVKPDADIQPFEKIGGGLVRLNLSALFSLGITEEQACRMFVYTANSHKGSPDEFLRGIEILRTAANDGVFAFESAALEDYLRSYLNNEENFRPVSHSDAYRTAYKPSYRVVSEYFVRLIPIIKAANRLLETKPHVTAAIDGRCASGKTTAAELLSFVFGGAPTIHMDDFFLPHNLRSPERYKEPGGNVHYERFAEEVLPNIGKKAFEYRVFDCSKGDYGADAHIPLAPVTFVEGSYSLHPTFGRYADLNIFCNVSPEEQARRIKLRNGSYAEMFFSRWIPLEERYFEACGTKDRCDIII